MLIEAQIEATFRQYVPTDVKIMFVDPGPYLLAALLNPMVRHQIAMGFYTHASLHQDFLGWAMSLTDLRQIQICLPLLENLRVGLDDHLLDVLVRHTAAHEAHHQAHHRGSAASLDIIRQAEREHDCETDIEDKYPDLATQISLVYQRSEVFRRVFARMGIPVLLGGTG